MASGELDFSSGVPLYRQIKEILGETFVEAVVAVKEAELDTYQQVISSWEREHLLLNV